jgi:hypothetical protein
LKLGAKDAWQLLGEWLWISVLAVVVTAGLVLLAGGKEATTALCSSIAVWPILLAGADVNYSLARLCGYDRLWRWQRQVTPDKTRINVNLYAKRGSLAGLLRPDSEVTGVIWDPAGVATRTDELHFIGALASTFLTYPALGGPAGPLAPGTYWISWQWRKPGKRRWRVFAARRVVVR